MTNFLATFFRYMDKFFYLGVQAGFARVPSYGQIAKAISVPIPDASRPKDGNIFFLRSSNIFTIQSYLHFPEQPMNLHFFLGTRPQKKNTLFAEPLV